MRTLITRVVLVTAAFWAAVVLYVVFTLPPRAIALDGEVPEHVVFGAYHVHSTRSDGVGGVEAIAAAARDAGLAFVVLTDHGDATRPPDPPAYLDGVLMIDAVEINTDAGHLVALGLQGSSPYPLAGHPRDVIADVHRLGGFAVAAHPDSPEPGLRWRGGRGGGAGGGYDGIEWLNADSEWRDEPVLELAGVAMRSLLRPAESVALVFDRPAESLRRWDQATRTRAVVGLAAVDAHGGISSETGDATSGGRTTWLRIPSYRAMFETVAQAVVLDGPLSGEALADAARVIHALRAGATFTVIRALAGPAALEFTAAAGEAEVSMGGRLDPGRVVFRAAVPQAPGVLVELLHEGRSVAAGRGSLMLAVDDARGAYRVEARFPTADVPWIVSNPIYVVPADAGGSPGSPAAAPGAGVTLAPPGVAPPEVVALPADDRWVVEHDPSSEGMVAVEGSALVFSYDLGSGAPAGQFAALVSPVQGDAAYEDIRFTVSARTPMRVSLQLRLPGGRDGLRWRRSVYVGQEPREVIVRLDELEPVGGASSQQPIVARVQSVLFVVDTVNARPGSSGVLRVSNVALGLGGAGG